MTVRVRQLETVYSLPLADCSVVHSSSPHPHLANAQCCVLFSPHSLPHRAALRPGASVHIYPPWSVHLYAVCFTPLPPPCPMAYKDTCTHRDTETHTRMHARTHAHTHIHTHRVWCLCSHLSSLVSTSICHMFHPHPHPPCPLTHTHTQPGASVHIYPSW